MRILYSKVTFAKFRKDGNVKKEQFFWRAALRREDRMNELLKMRSDQLIAKIKNGGDNINESNNFLRECSDREVFQSFVSELALAIIKKQRATKLHPSGFERAYCFQVLTNMRRFSLTDRFEILGKLGVIELDHNCKLRARIKKEKVTLKIARAMRAGWHDVKTFSNTVILEREGSKFKRISVNI